MNVIDEREPVVSHEIQMRRRDYTEESWMIQDTIQPQQVFYLISKHS